MNDKQIIEQLVAALEAIDKECFSHVDGRDLFAQMHPRNTLDIKRRVDARETWFEGDWLTNLWGSINEARAALTAARPHLEQQASDIPKIGCVQHDCAECQARAALPVGELTLPSKRDIGEFDPKKSGSTFFRGIGWNEAIDEVAGLLAAARSQPVREPLTADMFWNHDDAEQLYSSIEEFLNDEICNGAPLEVGHTRTIQRAVRLSNLEIRITSIDEESCDAEYEVIESNSGITQGGKV